MVERDDLADYTVGLSLGEVQVGAGRHGVALDFPGEPREVAQAVEGHLDVVAHHVDRGTAVHGVEYREVLGHVLDRVRKRIHQRGTAGRRPPPPGIGYLVGGRYRPLDILRRAVRDGSNAGFGERIEDVEGPPGSRLAELAVDEHAPLSVE